MTCGPGTMPSWADGPETSVSGFVVPGNSVEGLEFCVCEGIQGGYFPPDGEFFARND